MALFAQAKFLRRRITTSLVIGAALFISAPARAASLSVSSTQFSPADGSRTFMDIGGVWNGTTEVTATTGDTFRFTIANGPSATTAYLLTPSVTLPAGFTYVAGTAGVSLSGSGCPGSTPSVAASQSVNTLSFLFTPSQFDLPGDCSITFSYGLKTATSVIAGTYALYPTYDYSDNIGGVPLVGPNNGNQAVLVQGGASTLTVTPNTQTKAPTQTATFSPSVCNTGLGGLFAVVIDESGLNPNAAHSLQITSMIQTAPAVPAATGSMPVLTLPYLAPGQCFTATVNALVTGCAAILNPVSTSERTGSSTATSGTTASVTLDLETPLITFAPPDVTVPASSTATFSTVVNNTGLGDATSVSLPSNLNGLTSVTVSNVAAGWNYNSSTGTFTYLAGTIANGASSTLSFDLTQNVCPGTGSGGRVIWRSSYNDSCGSPYTVPSSYSSVSLSGSTSPIVLTKTGPARVNLGEVNHWNLTVTPGTLADATSDPFTVTDTLPATAVAITVGTAPSGTSYSCPGGCGPGKTLSWTVHKADLAGGAITLPITFTAPTNACSGGGNFPNAATVSGSWGPGGLSCTFSSNASVNTGLALTPGFTNTQSYNVANGAGGTNSFETGLADNGNGIRDIALGEGEFINFSNNIVFGPGSPGTWSGSTYIDDFAGLSSQRLVTGTLKVSINGGSYQNVPGGSITSTVGSLGVDLGFVTGAAFANSPNVANLTLAFTYSTTISDSNLGGVLPTPVTSVGTFKIAAGSSGCAGTGGLALYAQPLTYSIYRNSQTLAVSLPATIDVCQPVSVTMTAQGTGWDSLLTQTTSTHYDYLTPQTPVYGGTWNSGNITYTENGGISPSFSLGSAQQTGNGSANFTMRLKATEGTTAQSLGGQLSYDDVQTHVNFPGSARAFTVSGSASPVVVRKASLSLTSSPSSLTVLGNQTQWTVYVVNGGDGVAFGSTLADTLPTGLSLDSTATNLANPSYPVAVVGAVANWSLGNINPGAKVAITVVATVTTAAGSCSIGANSVTAKWGCGGIDAQTVNSSLPAFSFPSGQIQAVHDTTGLNCELCDNGTNSRDVLILRNTGLTHVYNGVIREVLNPLTTGIDVAGTPNYESSNDGGSTWSPIPMPPSGAGTTASPYTWDSSLVPDLADLAPTSGPGIHDVRIRFRIQANESANSGPSLTLSGAATMACGNAVTSPGTAFSLTVKKPDMVVTKTGQNMTTGGSSAKTVYGKPGDVIRWNVSVQNKGTLASQHMQFTESLPATGTSTATMSGGIGTITSGVAVAIPNVSNSSTTTYTIDETLGGTCVNQNNTAAVTWSCGTTALTTPTQNTDTAALVMQPDFTGGGGITQQWNTLNGGRGEIQITLTNNGSYAQNIVVTDTLFSNLNIDPSFMPTIGGTGAITGIAVGGTAAVPIFSLTGSIDHAKTVVIKFRVLQTDNFDALTDAFNKPETVGNGKRPAGPAAGGNKVDVTFQNGCTNGAAATNTTVLTPLVPYVGTTVNPTTQVVVPGTIYNFDFTLTNNGPAGSVADHVTFTPNLGGGWTSGTITITTPGTGGTGGTCAGICTAAQIGTLGANQAAVIRFTGTANANGSAITVAGTTLGTYFDNSGSTTGNNYSYELVQSRVAGYAQTLVLQSTSEADSTTNNVFIGEEATWRLHAQWFGVDTTDALSGFRSITVRQKLPVGLGYVSHATTGSNTVTISGVTGNTAVTTGTIDFAIADILGPATGGVFEVDLVTRVLNTVANVAAQTVTSTNSLSTQFTLYSQVEAPSTDGFSGTQGGLNSTAPVVAQHPTVTFLKQIRNVTRAGTFASTAPGNAGETLEYKVTVTNSAVANTAPAYDLSIADTLPAKELLIDGSASGGTFNVGAGTVTYNAANAAVQLPTLGQNMARLDAGQTFNFTYQATVRPTVVPQDALTNNAALTHSTLTGASGSETSPVGTGGAAPGTGELVKITGSTATDNVDPISFIKTINTTAVNADASANVYVGEQIRFEIPIVIPEGTVPNFVVQDSLPAGLTLLSTPAVTFGSGISGCTTPTITPGTLPSAGPVTVQWNFGTCAVAAGSTTIQKTILIDYIVQVQNVVGNANGTTLTNSAQYTFTGHLATVSSVALTVQTPNLSNVTTAKTASPSAGVQAADIVTYTVTLKNTGAAPAYDVNIVDTLPAGVSYVASSTTPVTGTIAEPDTAGQTLTWGRTQTAPQTLNIAANGTLKWTYQVKIADTMQPSQSFANSAVADYTSLPGAPGPDLGIAVAASGNISGERNGSGGTNNLTVTKTSTVTAANNYTVVKVKSGDTIAPSGFRVGDTVTYTLIINVQKGVANGFKILDTLPTGMEFVSYDAITPVTGGPEGFTYTIPAGANAPVAGATGTLTWDLGNFARAGTSATGSMTLVYRALIKNTGGIANTPTTATLNNSAKVQYLNAASVGQNSATSTAAVSVKQPLLTITKGLRAGQSSTVHAADTVLYSLTLSNAGGAADAFNISVRDTLPVGMRVATPTVVSATLNGIAATLAAPSYSAATGVLTWALDDTQILNAGQTLVINYNTTVDANEGGGLSLVNSGAAPGYYSLPSGTTSADRRLYPAPTVSTTTVSTPSPIDMGKTVDKAVANVGDTVTYTINVPQTAVNVELYDVNVSDTIPSGLSIQSVSTNAAVLGVTLTNTSVGNGLHLNFDTIPPNQRATITVVARVANSAGNIKGAVLSNTGSYQWAKTAGGTQQSAITSSTVSTTVQEPTLTVAKAFKSQTLANAGLGLQSGDTVTYTITVTNSAAANTSSAYNLLLRDLGDTHLISPVVTANPDNPGAPTNAGTAGSNTIWTWNLAGPLAAGATYKFDVQFTLANTVQPSQNLANSSDLNWKSTSVVNADTRDGSGGINNYTASSSTVTKTTGSVSFSKVESPATANYSVGQTVSYALEMDFITGQVKTVHYLDTLPAGLSFVSAAITPTNAQKLGGGAITFVSGPSAGATGALDFSLGDIESTGAAPKVIVTLNARVLDVGGNVNGTALVNSASNKIDNPNSPGTPITTAAPSSPTIHVIEPSLGTVKALRLGQPTTVNAGDTVQYRVTVSNSGTAPAFNVVVTDSLPTGLRAATPTLVAATLNGTVATLAAPTYSSATGLLTFTLSDAQVLNSAQTLVIDYNATVDGTVGGGLTLSNSARTTDYYSIASAGSPPERRHYGPTATSSQNVNTPSPTNMGKSVDVSTANVGDTVTYTLTIPNTAVNVELYDVNVSDTVPSGLAIQSVSTNGGALGATVTDTTVGNAVHLLFNQIPANQKATVTIVARVKNVAGNVNGTVISNSGSYTWAKLSGGAQQTAITSSAVTTTVKEPALAVTKVFKSQTLANATQGLQSGDTLTYTLSVTNSGTGPAYNVFLRDIGDALLLTPLVTANPDNPGAPTNAGTAGGNTTWTWNLAGPIAVGATYKFDIQFTISSGVQPIQNLVNTDDATWKSTATVNADTRDGSGGVNTYSATNPSPVTKTTGPVTFTKVEGPPVAGNYAVGEHAKYTLELDFITGQVKIIHFADTLPAGLDFFAATLTPTNAQKLGGGAITFTPPAVGATGALDFSFGDVESTGTNPKLSLLVEARVLDVVGNVNGTALTNVASGKIDNPSTPGTPVVIPATSNPVIHVVEPNLAVVKSLRAGQPTTVNASDTVRYRVTVTNSGTSPAYNVMLTDTIPTGMRVAAPTNVTATLNGAAATIAAPVYVTGTGVATWTLSDAQPINAGQTLVLDYNATVDATTGGGLTLVNSALSSNSYSRDSTHSTERRHYGPTTASTTTVGTPSPTDMGKAVNITSANIGDTVTYTLTVPSTAVNVTLYDVNVLDAIPANLAVSSITTNAVTLGATLTNASAGQNVNLTFDKIPANQQATITVTTRVSNVAANVNAVTKSNTAVYNWAKVAGGSAQPAIASPTVVTTLKEPTLSVTKIFKSKTLANVGQGLQAGDSITYTITLVNSGTGPAYNVALRDLGDIRLISPVVTANPDTPGAPTNGGVSGSNTIWNWAIAGPIAAGATYAFDIKFTLDVTVHPYQVLLNTADATWKSTAVGNPDTRDGTGGAVNTYSASNATPVSQTTGGVTFTKTEGAPATGLYAIGNTVLYALELDFITGQINSVHFLDSLPAGMAFVSAGVVPTNAQKLGGGTINYTGVSAGATGSLDFSLGDIESTGANPKVKLNITARILDVPGNANTTAVPASGTALANTASATIDNPNSPGTPLPIAAPSGVTVHVTEPKLVFALDGPGSINLASNGTFTARLNNIWTSSGFQPIVKIQLPVGMQAGDPTVLGAITAAITGGRTLSLSAGSDFSSNYNSGTGVLTLTFSSAAAYVAVGETLTVTFLATLDPATSNATILNVIGTITQWVSQDQSAGVKPETRVITTVLGVGTTGTPNGALGDDATDNAQITANAPTLGFTKAVNTTTSVPGAVLNYTQLITNTGGSTLTSLNFIDDMDTWFAAGTLASVVVTPAPGGTAGTLGTLPSGGTNSTGRITITGATIPVGQTLTVTYQIQLKPVIPSGTVVKNEGQFTAAGYLQTFKSDSTNPADLTSSDHSTRTTITSAPLITFNKISADVNGAPLNVGDILQYTLTLTNSGNENLKSAIVQDSIPSNTTYVPGTTTLNGSTVADVGGNSPLINGVTINGAGDSSGWLNVGHTATLTFQVKINPGVVVGTAIRNQGQLNGSGEGSGPQPTKLSDDPRTTATPDPTTDVVGNVPLLYAVKSVSDTNGSPTLAGHILEYNIVVRNVGATPAHNVVLKDAIPANTAYTVGTIQFAAAGNGAPGAYVAQTDGADGDAGDFNVTQSGAIAVKLGTLLPGFETGVKFRVTVAGAAASGTVISNQGYITSDELPQLPTDALGVLGGPPQPTILVVGNVPEIVATKTALGATGGVVKPGDTIRYAITLRNVGSAPATTVVLTDAVPPTPTTYVASTTTLNGVTIADASGVSALVAGLAVGTIAPGSSATVGFQVQVPIGTPPKTTITNSATYTAAGGITGTAGPIQIEVGGAPGVGNVRGTVYLDLNHNRVYDAGEPVQSGWTVEILFGGKVLGTTVTDSSGNYEILGLPPGPGYIIRFRHPGNNVVYGQPLTVTLNSGLIVIDQNLPLDPNGVVYDAVTRQPIAGVVAHFTGPVGFNPALHLPAGQPEQVTGNDGFYRFDLLPAAPVGIYTLSLTAPNSYLPFPSSMIKATAGPLLANAGPAPYLVQPQSTAPTLSENSTYYLTFNLDPSSPTKQDVVNNHVPLDPILKGAIALTKTTPMQNVVTGGLVPYTIVARNTTAATLSNIDLFDQLPPGFKLIAHSVHIGPLALEPESVGRLLTFKSITFAPGEIKTLKMVLVVGAGVSYGDYVNEAWATNSIAKSEVSNHATATVRITPDPMFDCSDVIGKVFDDKNRNGIQDEGEMGLPRVRLASARGWIITTDEYGRFHIACPAIPNEFRGSNFILKVDERTLPSGYRITTENPRVVHMTRGKAVKIDFGAAIHRVVRLELKDAAFVKGSVELKKHWQDKFTLILPTLREQPSVLRLAYWSAADDRDLVKRRLSTLKKKMIDLWKQVEKKNELTIEEELSWAREGVHE